MRIWFLALTNIQPRVAGGSIPPRHSREGHGLRQGIYSRHILLDLVLPTKEVLVGLLAGMTFQGMLMNFWACKDCIRRWLGVIWGQPDWDNPSLEIVSCREEQNLVFPICIDSLQAPSIRDHNRPQALTAYLKSLDCEEIRGDRLSRIITSQH